MIDDDSGEFVGPFLVVAPHPDDDVIGCGGLIAKAVAQGDRVKVVYLTSGELGAPGQDPAVVLEWRERDARAAAAFLGVEAVEFWEQPDGDLTVDATLVGRLARTVDEYRPGTILVTHIDEAHRDHRSASQLLRRAMTPYYRSGAWPVVLEYEVWTPMPGYDRTVDISGYIDAKLEAIRHHVSQVTRVKFDDAALALARFRGELHNRPHGPYAEVFREWGGADFAEG